jgi:hypothetical protein
VRNLLHRIAEAIKREPAAFQQIDRAGHMPELPQGEQGRQLDKGQIPRRD